MKFETLYKKTSTGKIQQWRIWTEGSTIFSESGQMGGKLTQTSDTLKSGKNQGTVKETTAAQQAELEAEAKFTKQLKKGYVRAWKDAEMGKLDKLITGGVKPMLAKKFSEDEKHIVYPCAVQPKLDGMRAFYHDGKLWSRTRKPIELIDHILEELKDLPKGITLDGELYNHDMAEDFEQILSAARRSRNVSDQVKHIQYHVYDLVDTNGAFGERSVKLASLLKHLSKNSPIKIVETRVAEDRAGLMGHYDEFLEQGYEGAMARNLAAPYDNTSTRSKHLQKIKTFKDDEFKCVGIEEGRGKLQGHVGAFICQIKDKLGERTFRAKMEGQQDFLKDCFENPKLWKGLMLTVRYQGFTKANNLPRFPVAVRFRSDL